MDEFELIRRYFSSDTAARDDVSLGVGDDAALLRVPAGMELAVTTDTLLPGVHFPPHLDAAAVGHRALAANLSDLAAMGAEPAWLLLALTLPMVDEAWLEAFSGGFKALARKHDAALVGGNLARGPLNITITAQGLVPQGQALKRAGARAGDRIYVTGHLGDAAAGLKLILGGKGDQDDECVQRFTHPEPRIAAGMALRGLASACIDISDGLLGDLGHILEAGSVGATILTARLPLSKRILSLHGRDEAEKLALTGGDDYELCFTAAPERQQELEKRIATTGCAITCIGSVDAEPGLRVMEASGHGLTLSEPGYKHF
ncbi:MAG TPA: thiamine-phosphate kinase [Gammaproteobacteria bacterium]|nr:thiamine-phosphate kinase [Gammaproteobacteria bacterium]